MGVIGGHAQIRRAQEALNRQSTGRWADHPRIRSGYKTINDAIADVREKTSPDRPIGESKYAGSVVVVANFWIDSLVDRCHGLLHQHLSSDGG